MCFVYAGVENGDFHAGARITRTAERAPRLGRADKIESLVQFAPQGRHANDASHAGQGLKPGGLVGRGCNEHRIK